MPAQISLLPDINNAHGLSDSKQSSVYGMVVGESASQLKSMNPKTGRSLEPFGNTRFKNTSQLLNDASNTRDQEDSVVRTGALTLRTNMLPNVNEPLFSNGQAVKTPSNIT